MYNLNPNQENSLYTKLSATSSAGYVLTFILLTRGIQREQRV